MNDNNQQYTQDFESKVKQFHERLKSKDINHFELLNISQNATQREIEEAYKKYSQAFSVDKIVVISDPEIKQMANNIVQRIKHAYEVLINYEKRAEYEKRGFRDAIPEDEIEEDLIEKAKNLYLKAKALYSQKQYHIAVTVLQEAIHLDPDKPDYYLLLGLSQTRIPGLRREAEQNLNKVVELEPWNAEPQVALGMLFYSENLYKRAESYFRQALSLEPSHALAKKKLDEIAPDEKKSIGESVHKTLKKVMPTFFDRKKKK